MSHHYSEDSPYVVIIGNGITATMMRERITKEMPDVRLNDSSDYKYPFQENICHNATVYVLCCPDSEAQNIVSYEKEKDRQSRILDLSSAHRLDCRWDYGISPLNHRGEMAAMTAQYISNPGCYAIGAIALLRPLVEREIISPHARVTITGISGYTGGGKEMVEQFESEVLPKKGVFAYSLAEPHKHEREIVKYSGIGGCTLLPFVGNFPRGMLISVSLFHEDILGESEDKNRKLDMMQMIYGATPLEYPFRSCVRGSRNVPEEIAVGSVAGDDTMHLYSSFRYERVVLMAHYDNLGVGSVATAMRNLRLMLYGVEQER